MLIDGLLVNVGTSSAIFFPSGNVLGVIAGFFGCNKNYLKNGIREEDRKFLNQVNKNTYGLITRKIKVWEFFNKIEIFMAF